ncbi:GLPGLI family protein [Prevotella disiens]|uniref:GLPGLI family protein n=1 Tax=Prevotella disiens TaxID=28130 RepID=A0A3E4QMM3_9BACT|nr:GLPGLI family protein [Prevotella disiens]RGL05344.1 GLPGLI family protein [Prevotella disiens]
MKRFLLTSAVLLLSLLTISAKPKKAQGTKAIDKIKYEITYRTQSVKDTTARDENGKYVYRQDDMRLEVGEMVSYFYSPTKRAYDDGLLKLVKPGDVAKSNVSKSNVSRGNITMNFFRNYPKGKTTYIDKVLSEKFRIEEPMEQPKWEIVADSTKKILNYDCQMARTTFKGRQWTAWFAADIPLDNGPWKLCGLPGLILRASDAQQQYIFDCVGMKQTDGTADLLYNLKFDEYTKSTMKEFKEVQTKAVPQDFFAAKGIRIIEVPEEMKAEFQKKFSKPISSNSIER